MSDCVFCSIAAGDGTAHRVYEDDAVTAFLDIRPVTRGHTLVVPKRHAADLTELSADLGAHMFQVGHTLSRALRISDLRADGVNLVLNDGKSAFQTVAHTHLHVVPRHSGDKLRFAKGLLLRPSSDLEGTAAIIREALERARES